MPYPQTRDQKSSRTPQDDRARLALLWRAFEEAEERIQELERDADRRAAAPQRVASPQIAPPQASQAALARMEAEAAKRHDALTAALARVEAQLAAREAAASTLKKELGASAAELDAAKAKLAEANAALVEVQQIAEAEAQRYAVAQGVIRHEAERRRDAEEALALQNARTQEALHEVARMRHESAAWRSHHETRIVEILVREDALSDRLAAALREIARLDAAAQERAKPRTAPVEEAPVLVRVEPSAPARPPRMFPIEATRTGHIPTIRAEEVQALRSAGINMTDPLLYADLGALSQLSGIGIARLWKLRTLAEMMSLRGIGPEWSERLFQAGARTIDDIAAMTPEGLEAALWRTYEGEAKHEDARAFLARMLPARCVAVVAEARASQHA